MHCWVALDLFKRLSPCLPEIPDAAFPLASGLGPHLQVLLKAMSKQRRWEGPGGNGCGGEGSGVMPRVSIAREGPAQLLPQGLGSASEYGGAGQALSGPRLMGEI